MFNTIWRSLTQPHPAITDIQVRRQSRLLAGLIITLLITSLLASLLLVAQSKEGIPTTVLFLWPSLPPPLGIFDTWDKRAHDSLVVEVLLWLIHHKGNLLAVDEQVEDQQ
jgi:hypothetical protein